MLTKTVAVRNDIAPRCCYGPQ